MLEVTTATTFDPLPWAYLVIACGAFWALLKD